MPSDAYAELHLHTAFSFLDGASLPEEVVGRAAELGYRSLAITDHDGLHGAMEFARAAHAADIFPITGAELTLDDGTHLTLLTESPRGYDNLCRLITAAHAGTRERERQAEARARARRTAEDPSPPNPLSCPKERGSAPRLLRWFPSHVASLQETAGSPLSFGQAGTLWVRAGGVRLTRHSALGTRHSALEIVHHYRDPLSSPHLDPALLPAHAEGLILLTGCRQGALSRLIDAGQFAEAEDLLRQYVAWFGPEHVVVELQHNLVQGDTRRVARLVQLAERVGLPYAATGNVHYHKRERHRLHDVLVAIRHRATLDACHRQRRPNSEFFLREPREVARLFADYPQALRTTLVLAERCRGFDLVRDAAYRFPDYDAPSGLPPDEELARICRELLPGRYAGTDLLEAATARLEEELGLIRKHGLAGFFLLHRDLLDLAREVAVEVRGTGTARDLGQMPPGRGRGSSVSSIVCYLIGLSPVDPVANDLFLGRFLNEEIASVPDIDLDFPRDIRERLIARVHEVYGPDRAAMVCAFATYRLRSAVRDVGKALGLPLPDLDRIAKLSEPRSATELADELQKIPAYAARHDAPPWSFLVELSEQLAGFPRHVGQHSGGMVVSSRPLSELAPMQPAAMFDRRLLQWDKDSCDDARVVKIDFLALGMLSLVEECLELIGERQPVPDLSRVPLDDPAVYEMIGEGDTIGTFQVESRAQIQMLLRTRPRSIQDLTVQVAIVRPGPIIGGAVNPYVRFRETKRTDAWAEPEYDHPCLKPVLEETFGVCLYQEQVIEVAMAFSGFTAGQADQLRRAMSRKRSREAMIQIWEHFKAGARALGRSAETTRTVFQKLIGFASYGFPKAHAASFAILAYQSCWLKRYYPAEFACALLNNQPMGFYPPHVLVNDAKRHGIRTLPPDVNLSRAACSVEGSKTVRIGLGYVKALGEAGAEAIVRAREAHGPFQSLADFVRRVPESGAVRPEAIERLILIGAFDGFGLQRRESLWQLGLFVPTRGFGGTKPGTDPGRQLPLELPVAQDMVALPPMGAWERMVADYDALALSPRYHPLGLLRAKLPRHFATTADLPHLPDGTPVRVAGLVVCRQRPGTAKGITFLLLEDERGLVNVIVYPALYQEQRLIVRGEPFVVIEGRLQRRDRTINLIAIRMHRLDDARETFGAWERQMAPQVQEVDVVADRDPDDEERAEPLDLLAPASHNYR